MALFVGYFETDKIARSYNLIIDNKYDLVKEVINSVRTIL